MATHKYALSSSFINRHSAAQIMAALSDTSMALVTGQRRPGKTTFIQYFISNDRPDVTLDDPKTLAAAKADPIGFIRELPAAVIDKIQRVLLQRSYC